MIKISRYVRKINKRVGEAPGTLIDIKGQANKKSVYRYIGYGENYFNETSCKNIDECLELNKAGVVNWINVDGVPESKTLEKLGKKLKLHPLLLEDINTTRQRAKIEDYEDCIFIVLKMLELQEKGDEFHSQQISLIIKNDVILSFTEKDSKVFDNVRERVRNEKSSIRNYGGDYLIYALIDAIVDSYFVLLEQIGDVTDAVEEELMSDPERGILQKIYKLKRELMFLRNSIWPLREVVGRMVRCEYSVFSQNTGVYLRDVYDHIIQIIDTLETYQDIMTNMLDTYLSSISNKTNDVMKILTIFSTIFIPLTFLAGIYGMNFSNIPELRWKYGYIIFWLVSACIIAAMLRFFKKKKWL